MVVKAQHDSMSEAPDMEPEETLRCDDDELPPLVKWVHSTLSIVNVTFFYIIFGCCTE